MKSKTLIFFLIIAISTLLIGVIFIKNNKKELVTITQSDSVEMLTIDEKIRRAEIIIVGDVKNVHPSHWLAPEGRDARKASPDEVFRSGGLFTDSTISINQLLKGDYERPALRVRAFVGEIEQVRWVNTSQPSYVPGHQYLLFLKEDTGPTARIEPGHFMSINSASAVYEIVNGKAISRDDEWILEDLIAYIQNALQNGQ